MATCESCKAPIFWALTPTGNRAPVDQDPVEKGNVLLLHPTGFELLAVVLSGNALKSAKEKHVKLRLNHYASCPDREEWHEKQKHKAEEKA